MKLNLSQLGWLLSSVLTTFSVTPSAVSAQHLVSSGSGTSSSLAIAEPQVHAKISNFGHVSEGIWRGGRPSEKAINQLASSGVKTIVDLRMSGTGTEKEDQLTQRLGIKYVHIPMGFSRPTAEQVAAFFAIVRDPKSQPVFVHCRQGADRTGTLIGMYRRLVQGWSFQQTYAEMREHHFKPFLDSMRDLVKDCDHEFDSDGRAHQIGITAQL